MKRCDELDKPFTSPESKQGHLYLMLEPTTKGKRLQEHLPYWHLVGKGLPRRKAGYFVCTELKRILLMVSKCVHQPHCQAETGLPVRLGAAESNGVVGLLRWD